MKRSEKGPASYRLAWEIHNWQKSYVKPRKVVGPPRGKLTAEQVLEIRRKIAARECVYRTLAAKFNVSIATIGDVVLRKTWTHLPKAKPV